jgi:hypothetical protein
LPGRARGAPPSAGARASGLLLANLLLVGQFSSYWKAIMSVRVRVTAFAFKGAFARFALPEFKTL